MLRAFGRASQASGVLKEKAKGSWEEGGKRGPGWLVNKWQDEGLPPELLNNRCEFQRIVK